MAYGETGGGFAGGLASGLQYGLTQGAGLYNAQAGRDLEKQKMGQEAGFRQQEIGIRQHDSDRADVASRIDLNKYQDQAYQQDIEELTRKTSLAQGHERDMLQAELAATQQRRAELHEHSHLQMVDHGLDQTAADAKAVAKGEVDLNALPDHRASNVVAQATLAPAIDSVDGDHHLTPTNQDGRAPLNQAHDDFLAKSAAGDHLGATQAAFPLVAPHLSPYQSDHALHFSGFNAGDSGMAPDDPHAMIGQGYDLVGRKGAVLAAVASDPALQQKLIAAHQADATQQQMAALHAVAAVGGRDKLKQAAGPSELEQQYDQHKAAAIQNGASPEEAHSQAMKAAVDQSDEAVQDRRRSWYISNGYEVPKDLQESDKEKAVKLREKAYTATGMGASAAKLRAQREIYSPEIVTEDMRAAADAPLKSAQADYYRDVKGQRSTPVIGSDGLPYIFDPVTRTLADVAGNPAPPGVGIATKVGAAQGLKTIKEKVPIDPARPFLGTRDVTYVVTPDGHKRPLTEEDAASSPTAATPADAAVPGAGAPDSTAPAVLPPKPGEVRKGYRFKSGDPANPQSWERAQ